MTMRLPLLSVTSTVSRLARKWSFLGLGLLAACAEVPGPSVPFQAGKTLEDAKAVFELCAPQGPRGASFNLAATYWLSPFWGGVIVGPITVAANAEQIRANGARLAVDKCFKDHGYTRRELSADEIKFLTQNDAYTRELFLDHLISGGGLAAFEKDAFAN